MTEAPATTKRKRWSVTDKLAVLVRQAICPLCGEKLGALDGCDFDHETALVNGGEDSIDNLRAVHRDCHKVKTFGKGGAIRISKRDSDISEPIRLDHIAAKHEEFRRRLTTPGKAEKPRSKWPNRKFQTRKDRTL